MNGLLSLTIGKGTRGHTHTEIVVTLEIEGIGEAHVYLDAEQFTHLLGASVLPVDVHWRADTAGVSA